MQEDIWKNRTNYKFYTDTPVPKELEQSLDNIINTCPIQRGQATYVRFLKCTQDDLIVKETLSQWVFKNNRTGLNELAPITAPLVYFICSSKHQPDDNKHAYLIGGAMLGETLKHGYDFSFIGCTEAPNKRELKQIKACIRDRFKIEKTISVPYLALCIGKGKKDDNDHPCVYELYNGMKVQYSKQINKARIIPRLFT
jgi:hypothetical protein